MSPENATFGDEGATFPPPSTDNGPYPAEGSFATKTGSGSLWYYVTVRPALGPFTGAGDQQCWGCIPRQQRIIRGEMEELDTMGEQEKCKPAASQLSLSGSPWRGLGGRVAAFLGILSMVMAAAVEAPDVVPQSSALPDASGRLLRDAEDVLRNFDELVALAKGEKGPALSERMVEAIRYSPGSEAKRQAVDRFLDYMEGIRQDGHPSIPPVIMVQRAIGVVFLPGGDIRPSYGVARLERILESILRECPDRQVRFEAMQGLFQIAFVQPDRREEIVRSLRRLRAVEEKAQDYPAPDADPNARQRTLSRIDEVIEMIESFMRDGTGGAECIADDEYLALQRLPDQKLLETVRHGPFSNHALLILMRDGCGDEELGYLFQLAVERRGHAAIEILTTISAALLKPLEEMTATETDRRRLVAYVNMLQDACDSLEPKDGGGWAQVLAHEMGRVSRIAADSK